jgi:hypothetical protein
MKGREGFRFVLERILVSRSEFRSRLAASEGKKATALAISAGWAIRSRACSLETKAKLLGPLSRHAADQLAHERALATGPISRSHASAPLGILTGVEVHWRRR